MGASDDLLVVVPDVSVVRACMPDLALISRLPFRGVIVTAAGSHPFHFSSRFFAPAIGISEDSVTGSAHCTLGPYWGGVLGKRLMRAQQLSERSGELEIELDELRIPAGAAATAEAITDGSGSGAAAAVPVDTAAAPAPADAAAAAAGVSGSGSATVVDVPPPPTDFATLAAAALALAGSGRVRIRGHAVTTLEGSFLVSPPKPPIIVNRL